MPQPLGHWALRNTARSPSRGRPQACHALFGMVWTSRPSADVTLLIRRVADIAVALLTTFLIIPGTYRNSVQDFPCLRIAAKPE
jgi:hypothetical protein